MSTEMNRKRNYLWNEWRIKKKNYDEKYNADEFIKTPNEQMNYIKYEQLN